MRAIFKLCLYLMFWQRILRGLFIFGVCLILPGSLWSLLNPSSAGGLVLMSVGTGIALLFPVMLIPLAFRQLLSGRHIALVPNLRGLAGISMFFLCLLVTLWLALLLELGRHANPVAMTILLFSTVSGYWLVAQWLQNYKMGAVAIWILIVVVAQVPSNKALVAWAMATEVSIALLALSMLAWLGFAWWLRHARLIRASAYLINQLHNPELSQQQHQSWLDGKLSFSGIRTASGSVLRGAYDNWRNRLLLHFLSFFLFPVLFNTMFEVQDVISGNTRQREWLSANAWLTLGVFGSCMISFYTREWLARTRLLWLRSGGDRHHIWQRVSRMTQQETLIALLISALYFGLVGAITDLGYAMAGATALLCTSAVWFSVYAGHLARLRAWSWVSAIAMMILLMIVLIVTIAVAQRQSKLWLPVVVAVALLMLGSLIAKACKRQFERVDWCQLRPVISRTSTTAAR
ncbi:MAG TPA: hypothetical protein VFV64_09430 [Permianibacter sp.]|nr:hypothetical protein [Permianibacter sp.]